MKIQLLLATIFLFGCAHVENTPVSSTKPVLIFSPDSEKYEDATKEYQAIWKSEGSKMVATLEGLAKRKFREESIKVIVYEGVSVSGHLNQPLFMRASYPLDVKKATLMHELGHRLDYGLPLDEKIDAHRALFLFLYDAWTELYGKDFADKNVAVEKTRKGIYDYESAWNWALAYSKEQRADIFSNLLAKANH